MLRELEEHDKDFIVVANKIDKLSQKEYHKKMTDIKNIVGDHPIVPFSTKKKIGIKILLNEIFS
jgi:GTP-binding protein EngB required for normal cell division